MWRHVWYDVGKMLLLPIRGNKIDMDRIFFFQLAEIDMQSMA